MARIRTIKPEFWCNEALSALPEATHLLAAALLNYADDCGYFNANPRLVEAACSPLREPSVRIHESLVSLHRVGYIRLGVGTDGKRYGHVVHFVDHQRVSHPTPSKIATISITWDDESEYFVRPPENFANPPESLRPEQGIEQGIEREQGKEIRRTTTKNSGNDPDPSAKPSKRTPQLKRPDDVSEDTWMAFVALRKAKKAPLSGIALDRIRAEAGKAKITMDEALQTCCMRGWTGFKADWMHDERGPHLNGNAAPNSYVGLAQKDYGKTRMGGFLERQMKAKLNGGDK